MAVNIKFDLIGNPEPPTIVLATRNGNKLGQLYVNEDSIELVDKLSEASELTFTLNKYIDGKITNLWDKVVDFKLVWCKEWDLWFEIRVELDEDTETVKTVFCTQLGQAELSQIILYNVEINTEDDINRDDYKTAILWADPDDDNRESMLVRLLEKAPHYSIRYVDPTIAKIQRTFSFDNTSIYDAFQEIAEEIGCLFVFHSDSNDFKSNIITEESQSLYEILDDEQEKIEEWGLSEFGSAFKINNNNFSQHKFGNVDMDNRIIIAWSDTLKNTYSNALASWDYDPEVDSIDTVFGGSSRFGESILETGVEIAYTPIVITNDIANFVDKNTVYSYIEELVNKSTSNGIFDENSILNLDKDGCYVNGIFVQNIIAATDLSLNYNNNGNWAETVGRLMHFSGEYGAVSLAQKDVIEYIENIGISFEDFIYAHQNGNNKIIRRAISVYDLQQNCNDCGYRGEFTDKCPNPKCPTNLPDEYPNYISKGITYGYGEDTTIFVTADELSEDIQLTTDVDSVKNCFKLEAGDDLTTATIRNCNPNGSDYIWYISDDMKADMSQELVDKIEAYDTDYDDYQKKYEAEIDSDKIIEYNNLVDKYNVYKDDDNQLEKIPSSIVGYPNLMQAYYNTIDLELFLQSSLMPKIETKETNAQTEAAKLITGTLSPVSVESLEHISEDTSENVILQMAKIIVDSRYKVTVVKEPEDQAPTFNKGSLYTTWAGKFKVTNYGDDTDTAISDVVTIIINDDYENFVKQKIDKVLNKEDLDDVSISGLFAKSEKEFKEELKKYSLNCLTSFRDACKSCISILAEQGIGSKSTWSGKDPNLYDDLYIPYQNKLSAIEAEIKVREDEINSVVVALQECIQDEQDYIHGELDFENYLDDTLWLEFCSFRREDRYSNDNYVSDGLNNTDLFKKALEFIEVAKNEIYKSAELQHSISSSLRNLLAIQKFAPLVNSFKVGNWLRILIDDKIYKLRLIEYSINYNDFDNISVEFSDVTKVNSSIASVKGAVEQVSKMASSYDSVQRQAKQGEKSNSIVSGWTKKGLDIDTLNLIKGASNQNEPFWDDTGVLFTKNDDVTGGICDTQLKIINSTMAITDDNWRTVKTAIGECYYYNPQTGEPVRAYGINAEVLVGKLILGEELGIYNESGSLTFNSDGFKISNNVNSFIVDPNGDKLLSITKSSTETNENGEEITKTENLLYVDENGMLHIKGDGSGLDISGTVTITSLEEGLTNGTTIINGGCIQTNTLDGQSIIAGTLKADQIVMTGSITWEDLDSDVQDEVGSAQSTASSARSIARQIANGTYSNTSATPFIDGRSIFAPEIYANEFSVYTDDNMEGSFNLFTNYDGSESHVFTIEYVAPSIYASGQTPISEIYIYSPDGGDINIGDRNIGRVYAFGEWNFKNADVTGLTATFG